MELLTVEEYLKAQNQTWEVQHRRRLGTRISRYCRALGLQYSQKPEPPYVVNAYPLEVLQQFQPEIEGRAVVLLPTGVKH